jgi:hypothetical protein
LQVLEILVRQKRGIAPEKQYRGHSKAHVGFAPEELRDHEPGKLLKVSKPANTKTEQAD